MAGAVTAPAAAPAGGPRARRARPVWPGLAALLAVLGVALLVGSGALSGTHRGTSQRIAALESQIRCPSCEDISVAQSEAASAVAVRHQIAGEVRAGRSDAQIEDGLVAQYGPTILLRPPARGLTALVWIVPLVLAVAAAVGIAVLFWRRSAAFGRLRDPER